jgi:hypothetical protein
MATSFYELLLIPALRELVCMNGVTFTRTAGPTPTGTRVGEALAMLVLVAIGIVVLPFRNNLSQSECRRQTLKRSNGLPMLCMGIVADYGQTPILHQKMPSAPTALCFLCLFCVLLLSFCV